MTKNRNMVVPEFNSAPPPPPPPLRPRNLLVLAGGALIVVLVFGLIAAAFYAFAQLPSPTPVFLAPTLTATDAVVATETALPTATTAPVTRTSTPTAEITPMPAELTALVLDVINISTIEVAIDGARRLVYLIGLGAPPTNDGCFGIGRRASERLLMNRTVRLVKDTTEIDEIGRLPRYVYIDDQFVNVTFLQQGYARFVPSRNDSQFNILFEAAANVAQETESGCYAGSSEIQVTGTPDAETVQNQCNQFFTCAQLGTQLNYDTYIAMCPGELHIFDAGGDGIGCNQRQDWGYPP